MAFLNHWLQLSSWLPQELSICSREEEEREEGRWGEGTGEKGRGWPCVVRDCNISVSLTCTLQRAFSERERERDEEREREGEEREGKRWRGG